MINNDYMILLKCISPEKYINYEHFVLKETREAILRMINLREEIREENKDDFLDIFADLILPHYIEFKVIKHEEGKNRIYKIGNDDFPMTPDELKIINDELNESNLYGRASVFFDQFDRIKVEYY